MTTDEQLKLIQQRAQKKIAILNETLGLLDAACAKLQQLIPEQTEHNAQLLKGSWQGISSERSYVAEILRATHAVAGNCHCEGMSHEPCCPAAPIWIHK